MKAAFKLRVGVNAAALVTALGCLVAAVVSSAAVTDRVYFSAAPMVLVWAKDASGNSVVVSDFVLLKTASGTAGADLISGSVIPVVAGSMTAAPQAPGGASLVTISSPAATPADGASLADVGTVGVLDAADRFTAFGLSATTTLGFSTGAQRHSFYVASNTAFDIFAKTGAAAYTGNFTALNVPLTTVKWNMSIATSGTDGNVTWGGGTAQDPSPGGSGVAAATNLAAFSSATKVFGGGRRTAAGAGSIMAQSVRFTAQYSLNYEPAMGAGSVSVPVTYTIYTP